MNFGKVLRAAANPAYWPAIARGVAPTLEHAPALAGVEPRCVIDVGANKGQFSSFAAVRWPRVPIYGFEPLPGPRSRYSAVLGAKARVFACALGDVAGEMEIHVASRADSSSLLELGDRQKTIFHMDEVATMRIPVERLEDALAGFDVPPPALLKIDVQGFEYEVIKSLGVLRGAVRWIFVEASFTELYKGQKLFPEVDGLLREYGYRQVLEHNATLHDGAKVQADLLYEKTDSSC